MSRLPSSNPVDSRPKVIGAVPDWYPLSPVQQGMLFHWLLDRHSGTDIEQIVGDLHEPIDPPRFAAAWQAAVDHFSVLRTTFAWEGLATPLQAIEPSARLEFTVHDLRAGSPPERERRVREFLDSDRRAGVDLTCAPAMRVTLFRVEDEHFRMVWTFHHIMLDGRAFEVILNDVFATYAGARTHIQTDAPYREFIEWTTRQDTAAARAFWRARLAGFRKPIPLPAAARGASSAEGFVPNDLSMSLESSQRLRELADREGLSLNTLVLGAWALLLSQHSAMTDIVFGATKTTRRGSIPGAESMVGMFLATIPVRIRVDPSMTVSAWLRRVRTDWVALHGHEHLPLVDIQAVSEVSASSALFDSLVMFDTAQLDVTLRAQGGEWATRRFRTYEQTGFPLTLLAYGDESLALRLEHDASRMDDAAALRWLHHLAAILESWSLDASRPLSDSPVLSAREIVRPQRPPETLANRVVARSPALGAAGTMHAQIERQVASTPDAVAVVFGDAELTYRALNRRANLVAAELRRRGVRPETLVGICVERSLEMVVGLLGILKAGGAYVPLDPAYPADRITMMLDDANVRTVVTQRELANRFGSRRDGVLLLDGSFTDDGIEMPDPESGAAPENLAYVIFTSGSTGRPKGAMIEHRNVTNFFTGMDEVIGSSSPGVWLAVTSISFDISVLELFWTLARGFRVIIAPAFDRASIEQQVAQPASAKRMIEFGLFYFAAHSGHGKPGDAYRLLLDGARFADQHGFTAVWTPERHFHAFGGFYPNPAVTTAALSTITSRVHLRAGSIVLPLHNPLRVAEDWAVIDQLSGGRVGLSFASGWHANDFAFMPENFARRREVMAESIETVLRLWRGESVSVTNGAGETIDVTVLPRPIQTRPPIWIASAGSVDTFVLAGRLGANVLTNMLGQDLTDLTQKFAAYRAARRDHGHDGDGIITVMLHTFVTDDSEKARRLVRKPFSDYLASSFDLVKVAPTMFPAFRQPSRNRAGHENDERLEYTDEDMAALLDHAVDRYFDTAGLFGTPERALAMIDRLAEAGADEVACLIDFGVDTDMVLESLPHLDRLRRMCAERAQPRSPSRDAASEGIGQMIRRLGITHLQCTPSVARALSDDPGTLEAMGGLDTLMLGGEALPADLAERLGGVIRGEILNMYGPTETTVWSTTAPVVRGMPPTIGRPIANTTVYVLDERGAPAPSAGAGELYIGGLGVVRGYLDRPELTRERFLPDPFVPGGRMYRTGDIVRLSADGELQYLGRVDDQVKVNGYRIELGEIEATLARHGAVRQCVVVARAAAPGADGAGAPRLVAYIVPAGTAAPAPGGADDERVRHWQQLWNDAYQRGMEIGGPAHPRFRIAGWNDSHTGEPIPEAHMREWLDTTVERILAFGPRRVLEIGCGTGLILYSVIPHVEHYTGIEIAEAALEGIRRELTDDEARKVTLLQQAADELTGVPDRSVDLVVINSVAQYFPNAEYLASVLRRASELIADGGRIFVGDVRSLEQLDSFHTALELHQAPADLLPSALRARIDRRIAQESELVISDKFFEALVGEVPRLVCVEVELKRGTARNELTAFRYDVTLHVGPARAPAQAAPVPTTVAGVADVAAVRRLLDSSPEVVHLTDLPNARLAGVVAARRALDGGHHTVGSLRALLDDVEQGIDPEALYSIDDAYEVRVRWAASGDPARVDATLRRRGSTQALPGALCAPRAMGSEYTNVPVSRNGELVLFSQLRAHLRRSLPEYMIPSTFVSITAMPLTPNGKIDRKALPSPEAVTPSVTIGHIAPIGDLERQIADIWRDLLAIETVGRQDNIFDLGANSLLTMQANSRLSRILGRPLPLVSMFRYPTVASLAAHLGEDGPGASPAMTDTRIRDRAMRAEQAAERRRAIRAEQGDR